MIEEDDEGEDTVFKNLSWETPTKHLDETG
jgi:hypothetical protein